MNERIYRRGRDRKKMKCTVNSKNHPPIPHLVFLSTYIRRCCFFFFFFTSYFSHTFFFSLLLFFVLNPYSVSLALFLAPSSYFFMNKKKNLSGLFMRCDLLRSIILLFAILVFVREPLGSFRCMYKFFCIFKNIL